MNAPLHTAEEIRQHLQQSWKLLETLRDEVRVDLHLAGMETREAWKKLEHRFFDAEKRLTEVTQTSRQMLEDTLQAVRDFKQGMKHNGRKI